MILSGTYFSSLSFVSLFSKSIILFLSDVLLLSTFTNYSFSPNFLNFLHICINYLKFSDYFCFFTVLSFSISAFNKIGCSTLSNLTSLFLFPLLFAYLLLPTLFTYLSLHYHLPILLYFVFEIYSLLFTSIFSHLSCSTLYHTRPLTKSPSSDIVPTSSKGKESDELLYMVRSLVMVREPVASAMELTKHANGFCSIEE